MDQAALPGSPNRAAKTLGVIATEYQEKAPAGGPSWGFETLAAGAVSGGRRTGAAASGTG